MQKLLMFGCVGVLAFGASLVYLAGFVAIACLGVATAVFLFLAAFGLFGWVVLGSDAGLRTMLGFLMWGGGSFVAMMAIIWVQESLKDWTTRVGQQAAERRRLANVGRAMQRQLGDRHSPLNSMDAPFNP